MIFRKQNVTDTRSVGRIDGRTDGHSDVKTVYPRTQFAEYMHVQVQYQVNIFDNLEML